MDVIGAGFGRTGTLSLKTALETLGFGPCYHMSTVFEHLHHIPIWQAVGDGRHVDWETVFAGYRAAVDWPTSAFYTRLMAAYPRAKVILTVRDPDAWYASVRRTIYHEPDDQLPPDTPPELVAHRRMADTIIWDGLFRGGFADRAHAIDIFNRHIAEVKSAVPADRLLVYNVREGWEPLTRFLDVETPAIPFPHLNDTASFLENREARRNSLSAGQP
jgi:hypothetical protein